MDLKPVIRTLEGLQVKSSLSSKERITVALSLIETLICPKNKLTYLLISEALESWRKLQRDYVSPFQQKQ